MPNWVMNNVTFEGSKSVLKKMRNFMKSEETEFDFNKLIKMPEALNLIAGSEETIAVSCAKARRAGEKTSKEYEKEWAKNKTFEEWADLGDKYLDNIDRYGASNWYDWRISNWDTKWNARDASWSDDNSSVSFETAWSMPEAIFKELSRRYPSISIYIEFADEDIGNNCGTWKLPEEDSPTYLNDEEFACNVWGYDYDEIIAEREDECEDAE